MIWDLKPYAEYKDLGLPWLGQVPGHWQLVPNRGLLSRTSNGVAARANIMIQQTGLMITSECNLLQPDADHERWPVLARGAPRDRLELSVCG